MLRLRVAAPAALVLTLAACGAGGGEDGGIPAPDPAWEAPFREDYYLDFTPAPVFEGFSGQYTAALVEELDSCGAGPPELRAIGETIEKFAASGEPLGPIGEPTTLHVATTEPLGIVLTYEAGGPDGLYSVSCIRPE